MDCRYVETGGRKPPAGFPGECGGPVEWRKVGAAYTWHYCRAHGEAHNAVSPTGGYEKVPVGQ